MTALPYDNVTTTLRVLKPNSENSVNEMKERKKELNVSFSFSFKRVVTELTTHPPKRKEIKLFNGSLAIICGGPVLFDQIKLWKKY